MNDDEFYIGYEPEAPAGLARRARRAATVMAVTVVAAATGWLLLHDPLTPARFDFGRPQASTGELRRSPYPELVTSGRARLLVGPGKHGAGDVLAGIPAGPVRLQAMTIARQGTEMLEVVPGSVIKTGAPAADHAHGATTRPDGVEVTLTGEIVDSKCFLGVMNPGEGTVHRDCARMCLKGGIPPALLVRGTRSEEALILLVGDDGGPIGVAVADLAGVPVTVHGRLSRRGERLVLAASASAFERVTP